MLLGLVPGTVHPGHQETEVESVWQGLHLWLSYGLSMTYMPWCWHLTLPVFCLDSLSPVDAPWGQRLLGFIPLPPPAQTMYLWCLEDYSVHSDFIGVTGEIKDEWQPLLFSQPESPAGRHVMYKGNTEYPEVRSGEWSSKTIQEQHIGQDSPTPPPAGVGDVQLGPQRWVGSQKQQGKGWPPEGWAQRQEQKTQEASEHDCRAVNREVGPGWICRGQGRRGSPGEGWGPMLEG